MPFTQHAEECQEHGGCTVIVGVQDGRVAWRSHMPDGVEPELRINIDHPEVEDRRGGGRVRRSWRLADQAERDQLGWTEEEHRRLAFHGRARGLIDDTELQAKTGLTRAQLVTEARAKRWDVDLPAELRFADRT